MIDTEIISTPVVAKFSSRKTTGTELDQVHLQNHMLIFRID